MRSTIPATSRSVARKTRTALVVALTAICAPMVFASGSMSPGISGGPDAYAAGKSILYKQVVCTSCPYAGRAKDAGDAKSLRDTLNAADSKVKLDGDDKDAVNAFLNQRFRLGDAAMADKK